MPSKQLIDLVNRLKKSGIQISFSEPRSKISLYLPDKTDLPREVLEVDHSLHHDGTRKRHLTVLKFI
ncbi:hypothetical protein [Niallia endozanthoxylica]|uniref:Uncharacterized protein n=1 Tax=Niallia endozanthoxylica TaxID=2036016 RepID=A0A5J5HVP7_9BACI|nr:hypothetical protein [Niallia endozanthoxylica]KAA9025738.1 hypothetical protein F4V44_07560 [Niallia endozanthoxylica]